MTESEGSRLDRTEAVLATFAPQAELFFHQLDSRLARIQHQIEANSQQVEKLIESLYLLAGDNAGQISTINHSLQSLDSLLKQIDRVLEVLVQREGSN